MGNTGTQDQAAAQLGVVAKTPAAGTALVNGTPTILSWTAPNDGQLHYFSLALCLNRTLATTGGAVGLTFTVAGSAKAAALFNGTAGAGVDYSGDSPAFNLPLPCDPGTTVSIVQTSALTAGAAAFVGAILGV
jgi:hypothetical protein